MIPDVTHSPILNLAVAAVVVGIGFTIGALIVTEVRAAWLRRRQVAGSKAQ